MSFMLPHKIDVNNNAYKVVATDRKTIETSAFLADGRFTGPETVFSELPFNEASASLRPEAPGASYIFHTAFCCSTLLAKAADQPGRMLSLKEPEILMDLANIRRTNVKDSRSAAIWAQLAELTFRLMDQPLVSGERNLLKPTNLANNILEALLVSPVKRPIFIIYSDLKSFLTSLLKKQEEGRAFGRKMFNIISLDFPQMRTDIGERQLFTMTDLQVGALAWHLQMNYLLEMLKHPAGAEIKTIHCDDFLADTSNNLFKIGQHLKCHFTREDVDRRVMGDIFRKNSKFEDQEFQTNARAKTNKAIQSEYNDILDMIVEWSQFASISSAPMRHMPHGILNEIHEK